MGDAQQEKSAPPHTRDSRDHPVGLYKAWEEPEKVKAWQAYLPPDKTEQVFKSVQAFILRFLGFYATDLPVTWRPHPFSSKKIHWIKAPRNHILLAVN